MAAQIKIMTGDHINEEFYKRVKVLVGNIHKTSGGWFVSPGTIIEDTKTGDIYIRQGERVEVENSLILPDFPVGDFQEMINTQGKLLEMYSNRNEYKVSNDYLLLNTLFALIEEAVEIKNTLRLKPWKNRKEINRNELLEEVADLTHFYLQLLYLLNIDFEELYKEYMKKALKNIVRQIAVEDYLSDAAAGVETLKEILDHKTTKPKEGAPLDKMDLETFIARIEREVGIRISNTRETDVDRRALLSILDKLIQAKGEYIVEKYGKKGK